MADPGDNGAREAPGRPLTRSWRYWALLVTGGLFMVLGVAGLFLPVLQGVLFLVVGAALLTQVSPRARLWRLRLRRRFPEAARRYDHHEAKARGWLRRRFRRGTRE